MQDIQIRALKEGDLPEVVELYTTFWGHEMNVTKMAMHFRKLEGDSNYVFLCAETDGKIIGTIQGVLCHELYGDCNPFLVMENFVVCAQYRRMGVGRMLLEELEKVGRERKCSQIIFITETERQDAIDFYQSMGFDPASHVGFKKSLG